MTEQEPGNELTPGTQPPDGRPPAGAPQDGPAQPPAPQLTDAELAAFRQWQAQHYPAQQHQPPVPAYPAQPPAADQQPPPAQPPAEQQQAVHAELAGMREQLTALQQSQQRVERATNPPLWKRILRSAPVRWVVGLLVVLAVGSWAINHYFGGSDGGDNPQAKLPPKRPQAQVRVGMESPKDAVAQVYRDIGGAAASPDSAGAYAKNACLIFTESAARKFGHQLGAPDCAQAFGKTKVSDPDAYQQVSLASLPPLPDNAKQATIDSCSFDVTGGPRLGTFTLRLTSNKWLISDVRPSHCG